MDIHGLQKMTLLDYPGKVACTVFLGGCQFRCPYCHNSELLSPAAPPETTSQALLDFLKKRRGLLDGVCVTGGEPLLRSELHTLLSDIKALGYAVKLDTNGANPAYLRRLAEAKLVDVVAMDVKNSPERYAQTVGVAALDLAPIQESVAYLLSGAVDHEFRTTVVAELHDDASFQAIGPWLKGAKRYYLQPFADRDTVVFAGLHTPSPQAMERYQGLVKPYVPAVAIRGQ